jgi:hypothetical protein
MSIFDIDLQLTGMGTHVPAAVYSAKEMLARPRLVLVGVAAIAVALIVAAVQGLPDRILRSGGLAAGVSDTLLLIGYPTNMGPPPPFVGVGLFRPEAGTIEPILNALSEPTISADGRDLYFIMQRQLDDQLRATLIDLATDTLQTRWRVDVTAPSAVEDRSGSEGLVAPPAAGRDLIYLALHRARSPQPITIVALDRVDGFERRRWQVDVGEWSAGALQLYMSPDNTRLAVLMAAGVPGPANSPAGQIVLFRFRLPGGQAEAHPVAVRTSILASSSWPPRRTPDGYGVYGLSDAYAGRASRVEFLDFATGALERVDLPFVAPARDFLDFEHGTSPDGRHLYVFAPSIGRMAIVDLADRRLEQTVPISFSTAIAQASSLLGHVREASGGRLVGDSDARSRTLQVSPVGGRMYASDISGDISGRTPESRGGGVLVIDTNAWQVTDRWLPGVEPAQVLLSADGDRLVVQEPPWSAAAEAGRVHVLDTSTGAELSATAALPRTTVHSLGEVYRSMFGRGPTFPEPSAAPTIVPARLTVQAEPLMTLAGSPVQIEARFVDPRTGQTVSAGQSDVRYDPPAQVMAHAVRDAAGAEDVPVTLHQSALGVYRASVGLPYTAPGSSANWTVRVEAEWADGLRRSVELQDAVFVRPSFTGTDGRSYVLQVSSEPSRPRADEETRLLVAFVELATGSPMPDGVSLVGGLPEDMEVACYAHGVTTRVLASVGHGTYGGTVRLWSPGTWQVWVSMPLADGTSASFETGSLDVQP